MTLHADLRVVSFMDRRPLQGASVTLRVIVIGYWGRVEQPGERGEGLRRQAAPESVTSSPASGTSDSAGVFSAPFDLEPLFDEVLGMSVNGQPPEATRGFVQARVRYGGVDDEHLFALYPLARSSHSFDGEVRVDLGQLIVGQVTDHAASLWMTPNGSITSADTFSCRVFEELPADIAAGSPPPNGAIKTLPVKFSKTLANSAVVDITGLAPGKSYTALFVRHGSGPGPWPVVVERGDFSTTVPETSVRFAFGSCHTPTGEGGRLMMWERLADRDDYDFLMLVGDQVYEYGVEKLGSTWMERWERRYRQFWVNQPMRRVLRKVPVYMTLDDHEVMNGFGSIDRHAIERMFPRIRLNSLRDFENAAFRAYRIFQQSHNPGGIDGALDYSFRRGPASFYVTDSRSARGKDRDYPVLGKEQFQRIERWSRSMEAQSADLIFVVTAVPLAFLPMALIRTVTTEVDALVWGGIGGMLGGPLGALAGYVGYKVAEDLFLPEQSFSPVSLGTAVGLDDPDFWTATDLADHWANENNRADLDRLLGILFGLANGPGKRRAVVVLSGDVHLGGLHLISSRKPEHAANPTILQITSSPISRDPPSGALGEIFLQLAQHPGIEEIYEQLVVGPLRGAPSNSFPLVSHGPVTFYHANALSAIKSRNFGRVSAWRMPSNEAQGGRTYRLDLELHGETQFRALRLRLDLNADRVVPQGPSGGPFTLASSPA